MGGETGNTKKKTKRNRNAERTRRRRIERTRRRRRTNERMFINNDKLFPEPSTSMRLFSVYSTVLFSVWSEFIQQIKIINFILIFFFNKIILNLNWFSQPINLFSKPSTTFSFSNPSKFELIFFNKIITNPNPNFVLSFSESRSFPAISFPFFLFIRREFRFPAIIPSNFISQQSILGFKSILGL